MGVLIGIPTYRRPELLRECLESIAAQEGDLPSVSVLVADNDAKGREGVDVAEKMTAAGYRFPISSTVVPEPGISAVRNAILDEARRTGAEFIAMIDDDETASPKWLVELLRVQAEHSADIVGGPSYPDFASTPSEAARLFWTPQTLPEGPIDTIRSTGNCLVRAATLSRIDWPKFDPRFGLTGGGDTEWFRRVRSLGAAFAWAKSAMTRETVPKSRATTRWALTRYFRNANHAVRIDRLHGNYEGVARQSARSLARLLVSPLRIPQLFTAKRWDRIASWASAAGTLAGLTGYVYPEYDRGRTG